MVAGVVFLFGLLNIHAQESDVQHELRMPSPAEARADVEVKSYIRKQDGARITEYSVRGHVFMVRIQPKVGPAYVLYDRDGDGAFETRLPGGYRKISPPAWVIKRF